MREIKKIEKKNLDYLKSRLESKLDKMPQFREVERLDDKVENKYRYKLEDELDKMPNFQEQAERIDNE